MPTKTEREYRTLAAALTAQTDSWSLPNELRDSKYAVEGYAAKFERYKLCEFSDGEVVYERFDPGCFADTDMSDVIMQYNHEGRVYARQSNGSLIVKPDDTGLYIAADLSRTNGAKELYDDIAAGMITKMSWGFAAGSWDFDPETSTYTHHSVRKIYDVSAVSIPANPDTAIYARSGEGGAILTAAEEFRKMREVREKTKKKIYIMTMTTEVKT